MQDTTQALQHFTNTTQHSQALLCSFGMAPYKLCAQRMHSAQDAPQGMLEVTSKLPFFSQPMPAPENG